MRKSDLQRIIQECVTTLVEEGFVGERQEYDIPCPKCGERKTFIDNPSHPTIYFCTACQYRWNPDNVKEVNYDQTKGGKSVMAVGAPGSAKRNMSIADPTREEMLTFLKSQFGREEGFEGDAEAAMYWFANFNHGGQWSNLYSVLSTSQFSPGPIARGPEKGSAEEMMYNALEAEYGKSQVQEASKAKVLKYLDNNFYLISPRQAKEFSVDGQLPRPGYEKKADLSKLQGFQVDFRGQIRPLEIAANTTGWIQLTPVGNEQVWAIRLHEPMMDEITTTGAVSGYMTPRAFDPTGAKIKKQQRRDEAVTEEEPLYVEFLRELPGEEPFMLGGQKYQYVKARYPNGKEDIGVYVFGQDLVVAYNVFRKWYNINEAEMVDPTTGEVAPGPRDRFDMQPGGEKSDFLSKSVLGGYLIDWAIERFEREPDKGRKKALALVIKMIKEEFGL